MRVVFDIPESEMARAIQLLTWTQKNLEITIRPLPHQAFGTGKPPPEKKDWLKPTG